jgi:hypothetical protein
VCRSIVGLTGFENGSIMWQKLIPILLGQRSGYALLIMELLLYYPPLEQCRLSPRWCAAPLLWNNGLGIHAVAFSMHK